MSQEDYATIMKTLSGNLAEGGAEKAAPPPPAPVAHTASVSKTKEKETPMSAEKRVQTKTATTTPPTSPAEKSAKRIVFSFKMDEVAASLFSGSSHLVRYCFDWRVHLSPLSDIVKVVTMVLVV